LRQRSSGGCRCTALRRDAAAGAEGHCWRLQCRSIIETQIQHPPIVHGESLNAQSRGVASVFRHLVCLLLYWLPSVLSNSSPEIFFTTSRSVCVSQPFPHMNKGPCPREYCDFGHTCSVASSLLICSISYSLFFAGLEHALYLTIALLDYEVKTSRSHTSCHCTPTHCALFKPALHCL
jgi:hypothetical protein